MKCYGKAGLNLTTVFTVCIENITVCKDNSFVESRDFYLYYLHREGLFNKGLSTIGVFNLHKPLKPEPLAPSRALLGQKGLPLQASQFPFYHAPSFLHFPGTQALKSVKSL